MYAAAVQFPFPGSDALLNGARVRIHQMLGNGVLLCFVAGRPYRAGIEELQAIPADASPLQLWMLERVDQSSHTVRTPMFEALEDFRLWCRAQDLTADEATSMQAFARGVRRAGGKTIMKSEKIWGRWHRSLQLAARLRSTAGADQ